MKTMSPVKRICISAACVALCYVLPIAFHSVGAGSTFSPMHIPVLLCGLICGGGYGMICGVLGPILSSTLSGMPAPTMLISMIPELCTYGFLTGLLLNRIHTGKLYADLYLAMIPAMLAGRIVGGIARACFLMSTTGVYSLTLWASSYFVSSFPGIVLQLVVVPLLVFSLNKAKLISRPGMR